MSALSSLSSSLSLCTDCVGLLKTLREKSSDDLWDEASLILTALQALVESPLSGTASLASSTAGGSTVGADPTFYALIGSISDQLRDIRSMLGTLANGSVVKRALLSGRLRARLDRKLALLDHSRQHLAPFLIPIVELRSQVEEAATDTGGGGSKSASQYASLASVARISDALGRSIFAAAANNAPGALYAKLARLVEVLREQPRDIADLVRGQDAVARLEAILDPSHSGSVSIGRFDSFLHGFGPLPSAAGRVRDIVTAPWFHSYLSSEEAVRLLRDTEEGTYLVRFSKSKPGNFAIALRATSSTTPVKHARIDTRGDGRFGLQKKRYDSLAALLAGTPHLKQPFHAPLLLQPYFHGDLTELEATEILSGSEPGTFLVRFALDKPSDAYAISYVDDARHVRHVSVTRDRLQDNRLAVMSFDFATDKATSVEDIVSANGALLRHAAPKFEDPAGDGVDDGAGELVSSTVYGNLEGGAATGANVPGLPAGLQMSEGAYGFVPGAGKRTSTKLPALPPPSRAGYTNRGLPRNSASPSSPPSGTAAASAAAVPLPADASYGMIPGRMGGLPTAGRASRPTVPAATRGTGGVGNSGRSPPARSLPMPAQSGEQHTIVPLDNGMELHAGIVTLVGERTLLPVHQATMVQLTPVGVNQAIFLSNDLRAIQGGREGDKVSWTALVQKKKR